MKSKRSFTVVGTAFGWIGNAASILSYIGIPVSIILAFCKQFRWAIFTFTVAIVVLLLIHVVHRKRDSIIKLVFRWFAPNSQYCYAVWESTYEYISMKEMAFRSRYVVKALQTGVDHIRIRLNWSGATEANKIHPEIEKGAECSTKSIEYVGDEFGYKFYDVYSQKPLNKGDEPVKLGININGMTATEEKKVSHHLLTNVSVITDTLHMKVILPKNIYPKNIVAHEYLHATDDYHWRDHSSELSRPQRQDDGKWVISWSISKPVYGGKYLITWEPDQ